MIPRARPAVEDPELQRPDWVGAKARDPELLWLDKNENRDPRLLSLVTQVVKSLNSECLSTYPESARLYGKLAAWVGVSPRSLVLAAGSDGVIRSVFEAYVSPGDTVIITAPTFAMYSVYSQMYGARAVKLSYRPSAQGPLLLAEDVIKAIQAEMPRLVCIPNPDSPTGTCFAEDDLRAIISKAGDVNAIILIDEAYHPFLQNTAVPWIAKYPHLVVARTTAKAWGMSGLRIGYGVSSPEVTLLLHKVRPMYECSTIGMAAFEAMLDRVGEMEESVRRLEAGKRIFLDSMEGIGLRVLRGAGNFSHVEFGVNSDAVHQRLAQLCYYRRGFTEPCLAGFSRFSSTTPELFRPIINAIVETVKVRAHV